MNPLRVAFFDWCSRCVQFCAHLSNSGIEHNFVVLNISNTCMIGAMSFSLKFDVYCGYENVHIAKSSSEAS